MKRFYTHVTVAPAGNGWQVQLDGRAIKTVGRQAQVVPTEALARALAEEWAVQGEDINPAAFMFRDMTDYALDVVAQERDAAIRALVPYAETDTLCYRADPDAPLYPRQLAVWEPILTAAEARYDVHFERVSGIIHRAQPAATLARMNAALAACDAFTLAALRNLAGLAASLVIGLSALEPDADLDALWTAASLEEEWQAELWGREEEAEARRAKRASDFRSAARFAGLAKV